MIIIYINTFLWFLKDDWKNKQKKFTSLPFIKEHLRSQIIEGGGKVYAHFEDIPKNKYKQCKIIAPNPCITAKYIQCLAAEIPVSLYFS